MAIPLADSILKLCKSGLDAYKEHLAGRQGAYNRQADKKQVKAIEASEKHIFASDKLVTTLKNLYPDAVKNKNIKKQMDSMVYYRKKFFKFH